MAGLKEIKTRIASVKSTRQITSAMKMVSAAYLRKAQDAIIQMRPYANKLQDILINLSKSLESDSSNIYAEQREDINKVMLVVITSNRGLCGAFNMNVIKKAINIATVEYERLNRNNNVHLMVIGKKAFDYFKNKDFRIIEEHNKLYDNLNFENVAPIAETLMNNFSSGQYDKIILIYNKFKNAAIQIITQEQLLPISIEKEEDSGKATNTDFILEPSQNYIVSELIPKSLKMQLFKALLDSYASEHGARMTAMHKATDNATDLIQELNLHYNKARQAAITKEILEIVGGAEALKG